MAGSWKWQIIIGMLKICGHICGLLDLNWKERLRIMLFPFEWLKQSNHKKSYRDC